MLKKILLIVIAIIFIAAGIFAYFFLKAGNGRILEPTEGIGTQGIIAPEKTIPESNVFKGTEINPFEEGFTNPFK